MARTVGNDEEREQRIQMVGEYVIQTGSSTRETTAFFSENFFSISNYTVHEYIKLFIKKYPQRKEELQKAIEGNKEQTIDNPEVYNRVMYNASLVINANMSIEEISQTTGVNYWIVYRDLTDRLKRINEELYYTVKSIFEENKNGNLKR